MRNFIAKVERLADKASLSVANLASLVLLALVALTCIDVVGRYFFNSPLVGTVELVRISMGLMIFLSFPLMFLRNEHVIVDLIPHFKRGWLGWSIALIFLGVAIFVAIMLGDRVWDYAVRAFEDGDVTEYLYIPRYPVVGFITLAIFSAALMSLLRALVLLSRPGEDIEPDEDGARE